MMNRQLSYMHLDSGSNGVPYVPGDGKGSALARVTAAKNIVDNNSGTEGLTLELNNVTSLVVGQMVISTDGHWGRISDVDSPNITVDKWFHVSGRMQSVPATGTGNLNVFPANSNVFGNRVNVIYGIVPMKSVTGVSADYILDYRMATATPVAHRDSVVGVLEPIWYPGGLPVNGPFAVQVGNLTNSGLTVLYAPGI